MLLQDKVIIISGVGAGMGRRMAKLASAEGAKVGLASRNSAYIKSIAKEIKDLGGEAIACSTDITRSEDCYKLAKKVKEIWTYRRTGQ
jgi:NADP-dependent 3-hydroxy acid dehydrogenase YdfG